MSLDEKNKLLSCIITTCKRGELLSRAIDSVLKQTYKNIEVIVIDDCPCKQTKETINKYKNIIYLENEVNLGPMGARNKAVEHANGEYVAFLDDDDYWLENKLLKQVGFCEKYSFVCCLALIDNSKKIKEQKKSFDNKVLSFENALKSTSNVFPSGIVLKKEYYKSIGGFDVNLVEHDFFYKLLLKYGDGYILHEGLVVFNRNPHLSRVSEDAEPYLGLLSVLLKYRKFMKKDIFNKKLSSVYFNLSRKSDKNLLKIGFGVMSFCYDQITFFKGIKSKLK